MAGIPPFWRDVTHGKKSYTQKANVPFQAFTLGLQAKMNQETPKRKAAKKADPVQHKDQLVHQATTGNKGWIKAGTPIVSVMRNSPVAQLVRALH